jgi:hypothetical protein
LGEKKRQEKKINKKKEKKGKEKKEKGKKRKRKERKGKDSADSLPRLERCSFPVPAQTVITTATCSVASLFHVVS